MLEEQVRPGALLQPLPCPQGTPGTPAVLWGHQTPPLDTASPSLSGASWLPLRGQLGFSGAMLDSPLMLGLPDPQVRSLEAHMYPEKLKVIAQQVQLQQQQEQVRLLHQEKLEREQQIRTQVSAPQTPPGTGTGEWVQ